MSDKPKHPGGRPTTYSPEMADYVCKIIATHPYGMNKLAKMYEKFPNTSTLYAWIFDHPEFSRQYLEAKRLQSNVLADSMLDLPEEIPISYDKDGSEKIDSGMLGKAKLDYEIKKWHASKMAPKIWGDAKQVEELTADRERLKQELKDLQERLDAQNKKDY